MGGRADGGAQGSIVSLKPAAAGMRRCQERPSREDALAEQGVWGSGESGEQNSMDALRVASSKRVHRVWRHGKKCTKTCTFYSRRPLTRPRFAVDAGRGIHKCYCIASHRPIASAQASTAAWTAGPSPWAPRCLQMHNAVNPLHPASSSARTVESAADDAGHGREACQRHNTLGRELP